MAKPSDSNDSTKQPVEQVQKGSQNLHREVYQAPGDTSSSSATKAVPDVSSAGANDAAKNASMGLPPLELTHDAATAKSTSDTSQASLTQTAQNILSDSHSSANQKLSTVESLANAGIHNIQISDNDGKSRNYSIEMDKSGGRDLVHLYGKDDKGNDQIALRGVDNGNGTFSQEKGANGKNVGFEGSDWARMNGKNSVGVTSDTNSNPPQSSDQVKPANAGDQVQSNGAVTTDSQSSGHPQTGSDSPQPPASAQQPSDQGKPAPSPSEQASPEQAKPEQSKPEQTKPGQTKPGQTPPAQAESGQPPSDQQKPAAPKDKAPAASDQPAANSNNQNQQQPSLVQTAQSVLSDSHATAAAKLSSVEALAHAGVKNIQIADNDGHMRDYSVQSQKSGSHEIVQLYGKDDHGKDQVVLRGIANGDGSFSQEKDGHGKNVGFEGSSWAKTEQSSNNVGQTSDSSQSISSPSESQSGNTQPGKTSDAQTPPPQPAEPVPLPQPRPENAPQATDSNQPAPQGSDQVPLPKPKPADASAGDSSASKNESSKHPTPPPSDVTASFESKATGYYPANTKMEGGHNDRMGQPIYTLQQYLAGKAPYVSVAMDKNAAPYGQHVNIPELNLKYGETIPFKVVDTGSDFTGKGRGKIDIAVSTKKETYDDSINRALTIQFVKD